MFTLPESAQEVFDTVAFHLLRQKRRSVLPERRIDDSEICAYRGEENCRCAAGILIPDSEYSPKMEEETWDSLVRLGLAPEQHAVLIKALQVVHDNSSPADWAEELQMVAKRNGLSPEVAEQVFPTI